MNYNKITIDSCVYIALYNSSDSFHKEALHIFEFYKDSLILLSNYVIQEVSTVLTYRFWKEVADIFLDDILNSNNILLIQSDINEEIKFFKSIKSKISFTDISVLYLSIKQDSFLVTFDKQLLNLYKKYSTK